MTAAPAAPAQTSARSPNAKHPNPGLALAVPTELVETIAQRAAELLAERQAEVESTPWLRVEEAADHLRCKPKRVYDLCSQRRIPFVKDGSRTLLRRSDLDAYLEASA
ncbi:MAG TPA: helix-turn-helix domain-containing protein [Solirubrobacterales bacterium]|nr:helix-turn-helix domain-containing protein [Solirubrobacterales bacterium]